MTTHTGVRARRSQRLGTAAPGKALKRRPTSGAVSNAPTAHTATKALNASAMASAATVAAWRSHAGRRRSAACARARAARRAASSLCKVRSPTLTVSATVAPDTTAASDSTGTVETKAARGVLVTSVTRLSERAESRESSATAAPAAVRSSAFNGGAPNFWPIERPAVPPRPAYSLPLPGTSYIKSVSRALGQKDSVYRAGNERAVAARCEREPGRDGRRRRSPAPRQATWPRACPIAARGDEAARPRDAQTIVSKVSIERARPPSTATSTASMRTGPSATSNCTGISVRKRRRMISLLTPMTDSAGPVMPTSVM